LLGDSLDVVDVFTGCYQATHVPSHDRWIATVLPATLSINCFPGVKR
jgi:hypothetical protein